MYSFCSNSHISAQEGVRAFLTADSESPLPPPRRNSRVLELVSPSRTPSDRNREDELIFRRLLQREDYVQGAGLARGITRPF